IFWHVLFHSIVTAGEIDRKFREERETVTCSKGSTLESSPDRCGKDFKEVHALRDDGLRLESVQKGSPKTVQTRREKVIDMATLRRKPRSRTSSTRQDRGSCSSTASCPVFSGPYSDQEEDPPMRRQSSPLLKGSLSSLHNSPSPSPKGSLSSVQGSGSCLQGSLPSLQVSLPKFHRSLSSLKGSISRFRRRSLGSLDNSSPSTSERSASPSIQSGNDSSSDDDASWDTNSWSSGATCLLRTPVKQESNEASEESGGKSCTTDQASATANAEPEIIYQNLLFSRPATKTESKGGCALERTTTAPKKDTGTQSVSSVQPEQECYYSLSSAGREDREQTEVLAVSE
ncbi:hypothetical protein GBF38_021629, partial [Nibea albiflora]